jgi:hypothetical protein
MESKRGGFREGSGRKPKADEIQLIERLSPMDDLALEMLRFKIESGDMQAIKLFFDYRFGKPKESVDHTTNGESLQAVINIYKPNDNI